MTTENIKVRHNEAESRFETTIDGMLSVAEYSTSPGKITFTHTLVPKELEGRGIARKLVEAGLAHARAKSLKVVARCAYVAKFMEKNREYDDLKA